MECLVGSSRFQFPPCRRRFAKLPAATLIPISACANSRRDPYRVAMLTAPMCSIFKVIFKTTTSSSVVYANLKPKVRFSARKLTDYSGRDSSILETKAVEKGLEIEPDFQRVKTLANTLKHNSEARGLKLFDIWPEVFRLKFHPRDKTDWYYSDYPE
jgi:hypothetical protein